MSISTSSTLVLALASTLTAQQSRFDFTGDGAGDVLGTAVAGIGDVNGDGLADLCVGAPGDDDVADSCGSVTVYSGASGALLYHFSGDGVRQQLGAVVAAAGDVNADGTPDFLAAARFDNPLYYPTGYVRVYSGANGAVLHTFQSADNFDAFGHSAAGAGDVDRDGFDDIVVGAPSDNWAGSSAGAAYVYSGRTGQILHTLRGEDSWDWYGWSVAAAGDVNRDGYDDFAVGIRLDDTVGMDCGAVRVYHGRTGAPLYTVYGPEALDHLGFAIALTSDTDGDGLADLVITGMNDKNNNIERTGLGLLCSAADGHVLLTVAQEDHAEGFGSAAAGLGDVDGDGVGDLAIGVPFFGFALGSGVASGETRVFSGRSGRELYALTGEMSQDLLGTAVAATGDENGDGLGDLLVGVPGSGDNGAAWLVLSPPVVRLTVPALLAGQNVTLSTSGGGAGDLVTYVYSLAGYGITPVAGTGAVLDLAAPIRNLATVTAGPSGTSSFIGFVPLPARGLTVYLQAYAGAPGGGWRVTPSLARTVQ